MARHSRGLWLGGLWLRVLTRRRAADLDRRLANGTDPMESDELGLRVGQLGSPAARARLAASLRAAVEMANGRHPPLVATRMRLREVQENEDLLLALADRLHDGEPLGVQGLAMTSRLISDRSSPLYRGGSLTDAALEALAALERGHRTAAGPAWWTAARFGS